MLPQEKPQDQIVVDLLSYPKTNVNTLNKDHKTALDIAEELPYSLESRNIRNLLSCRANELEELKKVLQGAMDTSRSAHKAAILIAQIAIVAIFTVPGERDNSRIPVVVGKTSIQILLISNSIAFFASMAIILIQITMTRGETEGEALAMATDVTRKLLWLATTCISVVFMTAIYIVVGRHYQRASIMITVIGEVIIVGSLGIKTYYDKKLRRTLLFRKKEKQT